MVPPPSRPFLLPSTSFRYPLTLRIIHRLGLKSKIHNHSIFLSPFISSFLSLALALALRGSSSSLRFSQERFTILSNLSLLLPRQNMRLYQRLYMLTLSFARTTDKNALAAYISKTRNVPSISCHVHLTQPIHFLIHSSTSPLFLLLFLFLFHENLFLSHS